MGVGKTTIGRALAFALDLHFIDSDEEIERRAGANISWIFDVEGEDGFRDRESLVISDLSRRQGLLVATGGGSVLRPENRRCLVNSGVVVFLDTSIELQIQRTANDKKRPLLQNVEDLTAVLKNMKFKRQPLYAEVADINVFVGADTAKRIVIEILDKLKEQEKLKE